MRGSTIAMALGAGSESRVSMGIAVIGGLLFGSALTLFVIPAMYVLLHRRRNATNESITHAGGVPAALLPQCSNPAAQGGVDWPTHPM